MKAFDVVYYNGNFLPRGDVKFSMDDRAFQYGDGLFETMHASGKSVQLFSDHMDRFFEGLKLLNLPLGELFTSNYIHETIAGVLHRCRLFQGASVKLSVWRNAEGKYLTKQSEPNLLIEASYLSEGAYTLNTKGLTIGVCASISKPIHPIFSLKSKNSLIYILAGVEIGNNNWDDGILLNKQGYMVEASSSNLFLLKENQLITPSLSTGCLHGVMRKNIIALAKSIGLEVVESETLEENALLVADEIFLSNAIHGIRWVNAYGNKRYLNKGSKKIIKALNLQQGF